MPLHAEFSGEADEEDQGQRRDVHDAVEGEGKGGRGRLRRERPGGYARGRMPKKVNDPPYNQFMFSSRKR